MNYVLALLMVGLVAVLTRFFWGSFANDLSYMPLFFVAVAASAALGGTGPGLVATFASAVAISWILLHTDHTPQIGSREILRLASLLPIVLIVSWLYAAKVRAERALIERDLRLRLVADQIPGGLWSTDNALRVTSGFGAQSANLHGPLGQSLVEHFHTNDQSFQAIAAHHRAIKGESNKYELEWGGRVFQCYVEPLRGIENQIIGVVGVATDITERVRAEIDRGNLMKQLETERARLNAIIQSLPAGVVVADHPSGKVVMHTRQVDEILRHPFIESQDALSYGNWHAYHPDGRRVDADEYPLARGLKGDIVRNMELVYHRGDGTRGWISVSGAPICDRHENVVGSVAILHDIDQAKRAEEEIKRAKGQLEQANKSKDQFLAMLSHELRTPLTPVLATTESMLEREDLPQAIRVEMEMVSRNVSLEATLIDDLLDLTRIARGKLTLNMIDVDAHDLVTNAINICMSDARAKGIEMVVQMDAQHHFVRADSARLQQVLWNVVKNAIKFTPAGGSVLVNTINRQSGGYWIYQVRDTGIGIDPAMTQRIFDAFDQGEAGITRQFGGLGLGLAISRSLIEKHGGSIHVSSEGVGKGAMFEVQIATIDNAAIVPDVQRDLAPALTAILTILLVEDHLDTARVMRKVLSDAGHQVSVANDVATALAHLRQNHVDLLISDLGLPDATGHDLMKQASQLYSLRGIALSGYGTESDVRQSQEAGFSAHLTKPVLPSILRNTISKVATDTGLVRTE